MKQLVFKFFSYSVVGCITIIFYFVTIYILVEIFHQEPVLSSALAFLLMTLVSYILNKRFTFRVQHTKEAFMKYIVVSGLGFILNTSIMYIVVYVLLYHYFVGEIVTTLVIPVINFFLNHYWTFKET